jgi:peptidase E
LCDGLGILPGSACPHYDGEEQRRPTYRRLVAAGQLPGGWAADDGAALVFAGRDVVEVVASRPGAGAYRVERTAAGEVSERTLRVRYLGS